MTAELDLLRPALEMAVIVARQGESAPVRIEAPRPLRPFLRFSKLPPRALAAARSVLDADDEFRRRVASRCDEEEVGRAGWLLLTRPEGWSDELAELVAERAAAVEDGRERGAGRDLDRAEATIREQQERIDEQARELHRVRQQLDARSRREDEHRAALAQAEAVGATAVAERARAVRELKDMERRLAQRTAEVRELERRLDGAVERQGVDDGPVPAGGPERAAWDDAAATAAELRAAWESMGRLLDHFDGTVDSRWASADRSGASDGAGDRRPPRRPVRLRAGLVDGTPEATRWWLSRPGAVVLVDGYNVTMSAWPELPVADQRTALERAAAKLQVQLGAQIVLVFDGDDDGGAAVRAAVGSAVRVRFTDRDTEADDEILAMVEAVTAPVVVVVSNDRRVLAGAVERGANTVRSTDFVAVLR